MTDPLAQFKEVQKSIWSGFAPVEAFTQLASPTLVRFAGIKPNDKVLDVGCGTGVASITAARKGAKVTGVDLTPPLLTRARENAALAKVEIEWHEGDVEALSFGDGTFDVVMSQFGHMFAPRPELAVKEMLRVLRPGGTIAFTSWPPELFTGRMFAIAGKYASNPPPPGVMPPHLWGDPNIVRERLGFANASAAATSELVKDVVFDRKLLQMPMLSPAHGRMYFETNIGPMTRLVKALEGDQAKLAAYRKEIEELISLYFDDNAMRQDFLLSRAVKI